MEDSFNKIITYLLSVIIFFLFPIYITYEKKDDITHALVSKATHIFVDTSRNKGYVSPALYRSYLTVVNSTGNKYEIRMYHTKKRYDPVVYFYSPVVNGDGTLELRKTDELSYEEFEPYEASDTIEIRGNGAVKSYNKVGSAVLGGSNVSYDGWKKTVKVSSEIFTNDMISKKLWPNFLDELDKTIDSITGLSSSVMMDPKTGEVKDIIPEDSDLRKYKMSTGDEFEVRLRNKNTTIATTLLYTMLGQKNGVGIPKIYIKYGGVVRNEVIKETLTSAFADAAPAVVEPEPGGANAKEEVKSYSENKEYNFIYMGKEEKITLEPGTYRIIAKGAQGGGTTDNKIFGGLGGSTEGMITLNKETILTINVGAKGKDASSKANTKINQNTSNDKIRETGGYNGGGNSSGIAGAGGGGCTEVSVDKNLLLVAAGGGGNTLSSSEEHMKICAGGYEKAKLASNKNGENGCISRHVQNYENDEAGAGAGYRGGKVIHGDNARCSYGGSNYINTDMLSAYTKSAGNNEGNGSVKIIRIN